MSEQFWATVLAAALPTVPALLALLTARSVKKDVQATREQVVNDHTTNLREENDERHDENTRALRWLARHMLKVLDQVDWLVRTAHSNRGRIQALEDTDRMRDSRRARREQETPPSAIVDATDIPGYEDRAPWEETHR